MAFLGLFTRNQETGEHVPLQIDGFEDGEPTASASASTTPQPTAEPPDLTQLRADFEASQATIRELKASEQAGQIKALKDAATAHAMTLVMSGRLLKCGAPGLATLHAIASLQAAGLPTDGLDPVKALATLETGLVPHNLTAPAIADATAEQLGLLTLPNGSRAGEVDPDAEIRARNDRFFGAMGFGPTNGQTKST